MTKKSGSKEFGQEWWNSLPAPSKDARVKLLMDEGKSNSEIQGILGLDSPNMIASVRHRVNHRDPNYKPRSPKKNTPAEPPQPKPQTNMSGSSGKEIVQRVQRRRKDLAQAKLPQLRAVEEPSSPPQPPSLRDEIIEAEVRRWGVFVYDPEKDPTNPREQALDLMYGQAMNATIVKLIEAGVAR